MSRILEKINRSVDLAEKLLLAVCIISMVAIGFLQIISRHLFGKAITWSEEILTYTFVWSCFIGAAMAVWYGKHFAVDLLTSVLSNRYRSMIRRVILLLIGAFALYLIIEGTRITYLNRIQTMTVITGVSMSWVYFVLPVSGIFMFVHVLTRIFIKVPNL